MFASSAIPLKREKVRKEELIVPTGPLVSVVIPTCNRAALLTRAIQSIRQQTYGNLEIIVVDDASSDDTWKIVGSFADPRIRYIRHDTNRGGSAARNTGIRAASGEFIAFLDDDDEWAPEKAEEQVKILRDYDAVMCTSDQATGDLSKYDLKKTVDLDDLRQAKFTAGGTGVLMAKVSVLKEIMFDETLPRYQDWDLFIRIGMKHRIAYLNKPLLRYNKGSYLRITNSSKNMSVSEMEQRYRMLHKHRQFFGNRWYRRHMCGALLFGIKDRRDKLAFLAYTARRYGVMNIVRTLVNRARVKFRKSIAGAVRVNRDGERGSQA